MCLRVPGVLLVVLLSGCATGRPPMLMEAGSAGGFPGRPDAFQMAQASAGLEGDARHPVDAALDGEEARRLLGRVTKTRVTQASFAPRRVLLWLLGEVLASGERVEYAELRRRAKRFESLVLVRPDGYLVAALTGAPLQRLGPVRLEKGTWKVGSLVVGDFYASRGGVIYPVNDVLRRAGPVPWAELGLERDWLNAALDGAQDAVGEMAVALAHSVVHPIRGAEDLVLLPDAVARLIASSPEYFARYGAMSREDQIREAARLATHALLLLGGGEGAVGSIGGLGAELPMVAVTAEGLLEVRMVAAVGGVELGGLSILHMAGNGRGNTGGAGGKTSPSAPNRGPGRWIHKTPTTESEDALDYQEQVTGQPAWRVYMVGEVEFDGFNGKELLEAKGPGYKKFLRKDGSAMPWYATGDGFRGLLEQAKRQSRIAETLKVPLVWHVAEVEFANFLRRVFKTQGLGNITVRDTSLER